MCDEPELCTKISDKVKMAGFLEKKGSMLWKRYWFVLEDRLLLYYKSQIEYINLSPCRGSLNMGLVSSVQPRRNSRDPVIHLVTRSSTLFLRAKNREVQEKWLQSLLDSIGRQGASLRFSLDDLPGEIQAVTLPRRFHTGSLDAVWKPTPIIPKNKMFDKVVGYEEETIDENQNTDVNMKSMTYDGRRTDTTFEKLRKTLARRKSSTAMEPEPVPPKLRRETFLTKMFKKSPTKSAKDIEVTDSDIDDPLYDKIDNLKITETVQPTQKPFGAKLLLPEGHLAELKNKLKSKESLLSLTSQEDSDSLPPALPPRGPSSSMTTLNDETTIAIIHSEIDANIDTCNESEDSLSGHYQTISSNSQSINNQELEIPKPEDGIEKTVEVHYQVIDKEKKKKNKLKRQNNEVVDSATEVKIEDLQQIFEPRNGDESKVGCENKEEIFDTKVELEIKQDTDEQVQVETIDSTIDIDQMDKSQIEEQVQIVNTETTTEEAKLNNSEAVESEKDRYVVHIIVDGIPPKETIVENEVQPEKKITEDDIATGLTDLNSLLLRLVEITSAPLSNRDGQASWTGVEETQNFPKLQRSYSDPDYDIPRPHAPLEIEALNEKDRLMATEFFNKAEDYNSLPSSTNSLEPDSLEAKKEEESNLCRSEDIIA